jgi:RNA polymerase sigma-70 factor (ECF subfamily)
MQPRSEEAGARDEAWFEALYRDLHAVVLRYARRRGLEPDDLAAEVFAAAWRHRERVPDPAVPWLIRTAHHYSMHQVRAHGRRVRLYDKARSALTAYVDQADGVADGVIARIDAQVVIEAALLRLSGADQEVLRLAAWEQLGTAELAYVLECSEAAARVRLHRAKQRLERTVSKLSAHPIESTEVRL